MAGFAELYIDQGSTFSSVINLTDDVTNASINVANYAFSSQIRHSHYSANASANIICAITDAANGEVTMFMSKANTANLWPGRYVFDVMMTDETNTTSRILEGIIDVTPGVTR